MAVRNAIEIRGLTKRYGSLTAIENITFEVRRGELFGLIGPDGAGKTTLFRLLATLLNPDDGVATVDGFDIVGQYKEIRKRVGYMPMRNEAPVSRYNADIMPSKLCSILLRSSASTLSSEASVKPSPIRER